MALEMGKTIREILTGKPGLNTVEYFCWIKYYNENPFGYYRQDLREALNCKFLLAPYSKSDLSYRTFLMTPDESYKPNIEELKFKVQAFFGAYSNGKQN